MGESSGQILCSVCHKYFSKNYLDLHMRTHTGERPFKCKECGKGYTQLSILKNHILCLHKNVKNQKCLQCNTCRKTFSCKVQLRTHMKVHTGLKSHRCDTCSKSFLRKIELREHNDCLHNNIIMLICGYCGRKLSNKKELKNHIKKHESNEDVFLCSICDNKYTKKYWLLKHIQKIHSKSIKFKFCPFCRKKIKSNNLSRHVNRTHRRKNKCKFCNETFNQRSQMKIHEKVKHDKIGVENSYVCQICQMTFRNTTILKIHTMSHTGEKLSHVCKLCSDSFLLLTDLRKHLSDIHDEKYFCGTCECTMKSQNELTNHRKVCDADTESVKGKAAALSRMRFLFAQLLTKITTPSLLEKLGFGKRLIDEILQDCISQIEQPDPTAISTNTNEAEVFRCKLQIFLEWAIPDKHMEHLRYMTTEDILKRLVN